MSEANTQTASNGIHYFTCSEGRKWAHFARDMITGDTLIGDAFATSQPGYIYFNGIDLFSEFPPPLATVVDSRFLFAPADRIEIVTEHVEATVMDALQALVASGGKPVEGWKFASCDGGFKVTSELRGACLNSIHAFHAGECRWKHAYHPVTRVRIKPEVKPEPGYGFTLDGNPVPPPPEGWEIVPEGDGIGVSCIYYAPDTQEWEEGMVNGSHAFVANRARAYARRVAKKPSFDEINEAFNTYWHGGSKHRAIDAFRAGAAWAKEVRGE